MKASSWGDWDISPACSTSCEVQQFTQGYSLLENECGQKLYIHRSTISQNSNEILTLDSPLRKEYQQSAEEKLRISYEQFY
jgi:hypothetical protein